MDTLARRNTLRETSGGLYDLSHGSRALLSVAQPALGAVLAAGGLPDVRTTSLGLVAATAGMLCVYAAHDVLDAETDREVERLVAAGGPGLPAHAARRSRALARGAVTRRAATVWVAILGVVALTAAYALRPGCAAVFVACAAFEVLYCALKRSTWLKTLPAGVVVGLGGVAGWYAVGGLGRGTLYFFVLLASWEIFGRNLANDLADIALDRPLGIRSLALAHGPRWSARACFAGALLLVALAAAQEGGVPLRIALAAVAGWTVLLPAVGLLRRPEDATAQAYYDRAVLFPPLALAAAVLVLGGAS